HIYILFTYTTLFRSKIFVADESSISSQPDEKRRLAGAVTGSWLEHLWQGEAKKVDFYVVKGIVEGLFQYLDIPIAIKQERLDEMHPGRCAVIYLDEQAIGFMGQVHPLIAKKWDL